MPSDVNIGGMLSILPSQIPERGNKGSQEHQGNLIFDDQRGNNVQV